MINYDGLIAHLNAHPEPFGLLTMQATSTTGRLMRRFPDRLKCLFSAEHGFFGSAAPGEETTSAWHPFWDRPIHSLYGAHRKPTPEMLSGIGRMVIDLCDIGVRCYTYLATLKNVLEACAEANIPVVMLDRQIPLGGVVDGPMRWPEYESFVAPVNVPFCHGMTPGECGLWIKEVAGLDVDLSVMRLQGYSHQQREPWPNFVPPSPAICSWDSAAMYPMLVFTEAYPAVDCDRNGPLSFRVIGAPWMDSKSLMASLTQGLDACGVAMRPYRYTPSTGQYRGFRLNGILFSVSRPAAYYPVTAGVLIMTAILQRHAQQVSHGARPEWLDKLLGSTELNDTLADGSLDSMFQGWIEAQNAYLKTKVDLYDRG